MSRQLASRVEQLEDRQLLHGDVLDFGGFRSAELDDGSVYVQVYGHEAYVHVDQMYSASLRSVYQVDQRGSGPSSLELVAGHVARISHSAQLSVRQDVSDTLRLTGEWNLEAGLWQDNEYIHRLTDGEAQILLANKRPWQNPFHPFDANADLHISPADVLLIVNDINQQRSGALNIEEPQTVSRYVDTTGESVLSSRDALLVVNHLNAQGPGPIVKPDHQHRPSHEVPQDLDPPKVAVTVNADPKSGWNLSVELENFLLAPAAASSAAVPGEGHLHLYVDGIRTARLYTTEHYLGQLAAGPHEIVVQVSANDHATYAVNGEPIQAATSFTVPPAEPLHHHPQMREVDASIALQSVFLTAAADAMSGWNLQARVENFRLAPENVSTPDIPGEGHMHLYLDGVKITRLYDEWFHLAHLTSGQHKIRVELSANDHSTLLHDGVAIGDTVEIFVS